MSRLSTPLRFAMALTIATPHATHATFPGENGVIVFVDLRAGQIAKMPASGGAQTVLGAGHCPAVSPNGRKIAYVSKDVPHHIHVMNIDGTDPVDLMPASSGTFGHPTWSPDGSKLAFTRQRDGIYTMNIDGNDLKRISSVQGAEALAWSPRGRKLAFHLPDGLYTLNADGSDTTRIVGNPLLGWPSWAPDGRSLVATGMNDGCAYLMNPDGTSLRVVAGCGSRVVGSVMSPDESLLLSLRHTASATLLTRPLSGGQARPLSETTAYEADWSRVPSTAMQRSLGVGGWHPATPLAGDADFYAEHSAITTMPGSDADGPTTLQQVVAIGPDRRVYHRTLERNAKGDTSWSPFTVVPGVAGDSEGIKARQVAIAGAMDGSAQVVIVGEDDLLYYATRFPDGYGLDNGWDGFALVDPYPIRDAAISIGGSTPHWPGTAQIVFSSRDANGLYHRVRHADGTWTPVAQVPGSASLDVREVSVAVAANGDAYTAVTVRDESSGRTQIQRQVRWADGHWDGWVAVGGVPGSVTDVTLAVGSHGQGPVAHLAFTDDAGASWYQERTGIESRSSWTSPALNTKLMDTGSRSLSIANRVDGAELVVIQLQPQ